MKKKIVSWIMILFHLMSMLIGSYQMVYADNTKLYPELYLDLESMASTDSTYVDVYFYITLDIEEIRACTMEVDTYEDRYMVIRSMYDEIIADFIYKYYENDSEKVIKVDYDWLAVTVEATKSQILEFTEDTSVLYIESTQGINGYGERNTIGLLEAKVAAIANVTGYVDLSVYRMEQQNEIQMIIDETLEDINRANYASDIEKIVAESEGRLEAVKTDEQLRMEEDLEITPTENPLKPDEGTTEEPPKPDEGVMEEPPKPDEGAMEELQKTDDGMTENLPKTDEDPIEQPLKLDKGGTEDSPKTNEDSIEQPLKPDEGKIEDLPEIDKRTMEEAPKTDEGTTTEEQLKLDEGVSGESSETSSIVDSDSNVAANFNDLNSTEKRNEFKVEKILIITATGVVLSLIYLLKKKSVK